MDWLKDLFSNPFHHLARWCSRLARQPVTLEVDGSSPFRVANKRSHPIRGGFFFYVKSESVPGRQKSPSLLGWTFFLYTLAVKKIGIDKRSKNHQ